MILYNIERNINTHIVIGGQLCLVFRVEHRLFLFTNNIYLVFNKNDLTSISLYTFKILYTLQFSSETESMLVQLCVHPVMILLPTLFDFLIFFTGQDFWTPWVQFRRQALHVHGFSGWCLPP